MATVAETLQTVKENYAARLLELSENPQPSYNVDGRQYSWTEYQKFLLDAMMAIDSQISSEEGPVEISIQGLI